MISRAVIRNGRVLRLSTGSCCSPQLRLENGRGQTTWKQRCYCAAWRAVCHRRFVSRWELPAGELGLPPFLTHPDLSISPSTLNLLRSESVLREGARCPSTALSLSMPVNSTWSSNKLSEPARKHLLPHRSVHPPTRTGLRTHALDSSYSEQ